jgi:hypothetical protein
LKSDGEFAWFARAGISRGTTRFDCCAWLAAGLAMIQIGCGREGQMPEHGPADSAYNLPIEVGTENVVQTLLITPPQPRIGDTLRVVSVMTNDGTQPARFEERICTLDLDGSLELAFATGFCMGHSGWRTLRPGEAVTLGQLFVVRSAPGRHQLRVRHMLSPDRWADTIVTVIPALPD